MIIYAHGRSGTPWGAKVTALRAAGFEVEAPDLRPLDLAGRLRKLDEITRRQRGLLIGSSYGGLAALLLAMRHPERIHALLLLAPAINVYEPPVEDPQLLVVPSTVRTIILHGTRDEVVPISYSQALAARSGMGTRLVEVDDDHRLAASTPILLQAVQSLLPEA